MIMAPRAAHGQRHRPAADNVDAIINNVATDALKSSTDGQKSHGRQIVFGTIRYLVGRDLKQ